jgi:hypothetical protein
MPLEVQNRVVEIVHSIYGGRMEADTPEWLNRPGKAECGRRWPLIQRLYNELTGLELPQTMPPREHRMLDSILVKRGQEPRIVEVDEKQHFNVERARTLRTYPRNVRLAFPKRVWIARSDAKRRNEGVGFGRPCPPLFPGEGGRHRQRAFRDALADILPLSRGWAPTLRIGFFEVEGWIFGPSAKTEMRRLLAERL